MASPTPMLVMPTGTTRWTPKRRTNRGTCGATNIIMNANGNCTSPDSSGE